MKKLILAIFTVAIATQGFAITPKPKKTVIEYKKLKDQEPQMYLNDFPKMCYRGEAEDVPGLIKEMMAGFKGPLHHDQGIWGYRIADTVIIHWVDQFFDTTTDEDMKQSFEAENPAEVKAWREYDITSKDVLLLSNLGPQGDGTELTATVIKPCK